MTLYPNGIDSNSTIPLAFDNITDVDASTHNSLQQAILAIETELGIKPRGNVASSVANRLDGVDTSLASLNSTVATILSQVSSIVGNIDGVHIQLGTPAGGFLSGITTLQTTTKITDALNTFNNLFSFLAPAQPQSMQGLAVDAVTSIPVFSGKVADVTGHSAGYFKPSFPAGSAYTFITKTQVFTLTTHNTGDSTTGFSDGDKGTLQILVNGADITGGGFNLGTAFDSAFSSTQQGTTYASGTGSATPPLKVINSRSQVYSVGIFNNFPLWQKAVARITNATLTPGYNTFQFVHIVGASTRSSQIYELFYDSGSSTPLFTTPTITPGGSSFKFLSGIKYLANGCTLQLQTIISNAFVNTYLQTPINYSFTAGIPSTVGALTDGSIVVGPTGSNSAPNSTDTLTVNRTFNITVSNQQTVNQVATIAYSNIYGTTYSAVSANQNMLVNTYGNVSTALADNFFDENYRLLPDIHGDTGTASAYPNDYIGIPPTITGQWTSTAALTNGNAQVYNAAVRYPAINFTSGFVPTQGGSTNYSTFNNSNPHSGQVYYRAFYDGSIAHSNGTISIGGIALTDLQGSPNVKVELKFPGTTGWKDLSLPFNSGTFVPATNGQGCRTNAVAITGGTAFGWSMGTASTATSGNMYILRITLFNTTKPITFLSESFVGS